MWSSLKRLFAPPADITAFDDANPGRVTLVGAARADESGVLRSPMEDQTCLAYYYKAVWKAPSRGSSIPRVLKQAEVYVPHFRLEMEGGSILVQCRPSDPFDRKDHQDAQASNLPGFEAAEQLIRPGDRLRIKGRLKREEEDLVVKPSQIENLGPAPAPLPEKAGEASAPPRAPKGKYHPRARRKAREARET